MKREERRNDFSLFILRSDRAPHSQSDRIRYLRDTHYLSETHDDVDDRSWTTQLSFLHNLLAAARLDGRRATGGGIELAALARAAWQWTHRSENPRTVGRRFRG